MKNSWKTRPKNASGITSREMLLNGSESLAFVQGTAKYSSSKRYVLPTLGCAIFSLPPYFSFMDHTRMILLEKRNDESLKTANLLLVF